MTVDLTTKFTGLDFVNPFILASAPPTESKRKILRAFEAGWGGIVTKTIGLHPVENVAGPKTIYQRTSEEKPYVSRMKRADTVSHSSWNWELISDQALEIWLPDLKEIKETYPDRMVIASIMAGAGSQEELDNWCKLAKEVVAVGCDAIELNMSCPHMDRKDMGANIANDEEIIRDIVGAVTKAVDVPIWVKLTPATSTVADAAGAAYDAGAACISICNTFPSLPLMDPETLKFEVEVDGLVTSGGLGGLAILPQALQRVSDINKAHPDGAISGIGGIRGFREAFNFIVHGAGNLQICTAAMEEKGSGGVGVKLIQELKDDLADYLERHGHSSIEDFRGIARDRIVEHSQVRRKSDDYNGGYAKSA
ncbi:dihydropyrimidine dehydrogenase (NADP+)/dihydropyrimidine dehydrogenase (NAD+) subunit PreA [Cognatiyoonia sediminum]|uniref:dihydrouracil dehydrogenase (NAD(+)) n=1 Tax=Cognatiyoonia sediminum TaxID=1508389 RepID=A0A1M5LRK7_9RHOB|nr:tRNA-dihydrouridine synthase [Cognatiyoonia sediminum]SHG67269.1 dihydropyrimidine dehydrogenase (NADP+)/dihydropyrimidine dehydrogenase (NAD+) subunit PreA [Cognatiyoonia sediminum]